MQLIYNYFRPMITKHRLAQNEARIYSQGGNCDAFYIPGKMTPLYVVKVVGL